MHALVVDAAVTLRQLYDAQDMEAFAQFSRQTAAFLHTMEEEGGSIIHGYNETLNQDAIDNMF